MLVKALEEYAACTTVYNHTEYDVYVSNNVVYKKNVLHCRKPFVRIIVDLKHTTVPLGSLLKTLQDHYSRPEYQQYKKNSVPLVCLFISWRDLPV